MLSLLRREYLLICWLVIMGQSLTGAELPPELERVLAIQDAPLDWIHSADLQIERTVPNGVEWVLTEWHRWRRGRDVDEVEQTVFRPTDPEWIRSRTVWYRRGSQLRFYEEDEKHHTPISRRGDIYPVTRPGDLPFHLDGLLMIRPHLRPNREMLQEAAELEILANDSSGMTIEFSDDRSSDRIRFHFLASEGYWIDSVECRQDGGPVLRDRVQVEEFWNLGTGRLPRRIRAFRGVQEVARWRVFGRINEAEIEPPGPWEFPAGTPVDDHRNNEFYIWGDGQPGATFASDKDRRDWIRQQRKPESEQSPSTPRRFLLWANVILLSLLGLIYLMRFWIRRQPID